MNHTTQIVFMIFTALIFVSVLIQLIFMASMFFIVRKMQRKVHSLVEDLRLHAMPVLDSSRAIFEDLSPKLKVLGANLVETSGKVRSATGEVSETVRIVATRVRAYTAQADDALTGALDQIGKAGNTIQHGISGPIRQISGIINGLRAGLNVICQKAPRRRDDGEGDLFI